MFNIFMVICMLISALDYIINFFVWKYINIFWVNPPNDTCTPVHYTV